jgi:hypothetical protein
MYNIYVSRAPILYNTNIVLNILSSQLLARRFTSIVQLIYTFISNQLLKVVIFCHPQNSMLVVNFSRILMSEFWGDPQEFRPERFIDASGKLVMPEQYLPFSFGTFNIHPQGTCMYSYS